MFISNSLHFWGCSGFLSGESFPIKNAQSLESEAYDTEVHKLVSTSTPLPSDNAQDCISGRGLGFYVPDNKGWVLKMFTE